MTNPIPPSIDARTLLDLVQQDDLDAAIEAGLMGWSAQKRDGLTRTERAVLTAACERLRAAWSARRRFQARQARLQRREHERRAVAKTGSPASMRATPALPAAAAAILARARERAGVAPSTPPVARPPRRAPALTRREIDTVFTRLAEINPHPTTELEYRSPFELLVAVILSAQATDISVNKATRRLFAVANTPEAILALGEDGLKRHIASIGLFNTKANHIIATCQRLLEHHGGAVPRERAALERLPGVGRKTANVLLNTVFGEPTIAVDTHIFRISNRIGLAPGKTVRAVEDRLMQVIPPRWQHGAHHWLILHGRYVCKARTPNCAQCVIADVCRFQDKTS